MLLELPRNYLQGLFGETYWTSFRQQAIISEFESIESIRNRIYDSISLVSTARKFILLFPPKTEEARVGD
jgi:hypothetical protein